ncbi:diguanylate cyclase [Coleofasciculus sp. FACHB-1120]|uniref:diguanylate cyclase domain-containing protein n=1 Tax=Coleofasciculus sp. FACHB-1120 TaxID=2692783 RepID=UPI001687A433|nr:diguanylate cyclase [Coleofasciculus sp. FACHB-1120]MBD2740916.1 diguanylate cyclase [Coleofasciculus sp. FACHB-1120]
MLNPYALPLHQAIDRTPLTVTPDTLATEAIALMSRAQASCVIVVQQQVSAEKQTQVATQTPIGIFTERDLVQVTALGRDIKDVAIAALMNQPLITLKESQVEDIQTVSRLFHHHQIRHLLIVEDESSQLVGIITPSSLMPVVSDRPNPKPENLFGYSNLNLPEREACYRLLAENCTDMISSHTPEGVYLYVSPVCSILLGYEPDELVGHSVLEFCHPQDWVVMEQFAKNDTVTLREYGTQLNFPEIETVSYRMRHRQGYYIWLKTTLRTIRHPDTGAVQEIIAISCDISQRQQAETELRESQEKYKVLFQRFPIGISITDKNGNIIEANQASEKILGLSIEKHKTRSCDSQEWRIIRPDGTPMPPEEFASVRALKENKVIVNREMGILNDQDEITWINVTAAPIPLKDYGVAIAYVNITERKAAEEKVEKSLSLLRTTLESTADGIVAVSLEGDIVSYNQKFLQMWQVPEDLISSPRADKRLVFLKNQMKEPEAFVRRIQELSRQPEAKAYDILELKNGRIFERYSAPHRLGEQIIGRVWSFLDITERKRTEEALRSSIERERLLGRIQGRIRQSLHLNEILNTAVAEVRNFLQAERVALYRLDPRGACFVVESVAPGCESILDVSLYDPCFETEYIQKFQTTGYVSAVDDIYQADLPASYVKLLEGAGIRANLMVPILIREQVGGNREAKNEFKTQNPAPIRPSLSNPAAKIHLWGILCVHQCSGSRHWEPYEIKLLQQLSVGLAIAIQQSSLFKQLEEANRELQCIASLDGLTHVANRRRFDEYLAQEWRRLAREQVPISLIFCDIDCFKIYNDTYGHQAGDSCLRQVAGAIRLMLKRSSDLVARYGGEEFALILPNTPSAGAGYIAESIRSMVKSLEIVHVHSPVSPYVTLSLGVASIVPSLTSSPAALIAAADEALYQAKKEGRDRVSVCGV